jgi:prepilin-type N-terminal cleavage/methylation domain-containing protein
MYLRVKTTSNQRTTGFTIVELLIVIVVIAILAVITIVAYNGIQSRAQTSAVQSGLEQINRKLAAYMVDYSAFPPDLATAGIVDGATTYQYTPSGTPVTGYCVTATNGTTSYKSDSTNTQATSGGCVGHTVGSGATVIANMVPNPSAETNASGWGGPNSTTFARDTSKFQYGAASMLLTMPIGGASTVGATVYNPSAGAVPSVFKASTTYNYSAWVYVPTGTVDVYVSVQGAGMSSVTNGTTYTTAVKNAWTRIYHTFTTSASGSLIFYVLNKTSTVSAGTQFWVDGVQITEGTTLYNYGDGATSGWTWNGTVNNSTSYGAAP